MPSTASRSASRYAVSVSGAVRAGNLRAREIARAVRAALAAETAPRATISIALVDDGGMAVLHERHMGIAGPTDVLTFDLSEDDGEIDGEIVISVETAAREAAARGHAVEREVILYAVHGTLHLVGYDDRTAADARRMHAREDELLTKLGIGPVYSKQGAAKKQPRTLNRSTQRARSSVE